MQAYLTEVRQICLLLFYARLIGRFPGLWMVSLYYFKYNEPSLLLFGCVHPQFMPKPAYLEHL